MSVSLNPILPRLAVIGVADDPYKKYWWVILAGIALTGLWLCLPILTDTAIGSTRVAANKTDSQASAEGSLEAKGNPDGAPGRAYDLSAGGAGSKGAGAVPESMLYQAPADSGAGAAASGAPLSAAARGAAGGAAAGGAAAGSLAQALKDAGSAKNASGWGEKAQRGFDAPHLGGGSLAGLGSVHGGRGSTAGGIFGTHDATPDLGTARGLNEGSGAPGAAAGHGFIALNKVATATSRAAGQRNADGSAANMSKLFDGSKANGSTNGAVGKGTYDALLDAAPSNLKGADPAPSAAKEPTKPVDLPPQSNSTSMLASIAGMAVGALIGGAVGGVAGQMIASGAQMAIQKAMQQQQQQQQCQQLQAHYPSASCS